MLIKEILAELRKENQTVAVIAKTIEGISEKPLRNALKVAGYEYSNQNPKGWKFIGEGEEPLDKSIFDYVRKNRGSTNVKRTSPSREVNVNNTTPKDELDVNIIHTDSHEIHKSNSPEPPTTTETNSFSPGEVEILKEMLNEWKVKKEKVGKIELLHERIKQLDPSDKQRRTIVIDRKVGTTFDEFCKEQRFNKSDIVELAILDFIERYS